MLLPLRDRDGLSQTRLSCDPERGVGCAIAVVAISALHNLEAQAVAEGATVELEELPGVVLIEQDVAGLEAGQKVGRQIIARVQIVIVDGADGQHGKAVLRQREVERTERQTVSSDGIRSLT